MGRVAWREHEGILHFDGKLYVLPEGGAHAEVLQSNHDDLLVGHFGYARTLELIRRKYYWPHMAKEIKAYMKSCTACQQAKPTCHKPYGELQSLQQPWGPYTDISMDFIVGLPPSKCWSKAYNSILVIMDRYTKMVCYVTVRSDIDTPGLAAVFVWKFILAGPGIPDSIVSDRGSVFTSTFWSAVCYHLKVCRRLSTAFHPQTDGQMERQNSTLEQYLWAYVAYQQDDWVEWLPLAKFAYNNSWQSTTGESPFYLLIGQNPRFNDNVTEIPDHSPEVPVVTDRLRPLLQVREALERCWEAAVTKQVEFYNKMVKPWSYSKGNLVLLSAAHINTICLSKKLDWKFHGPFQIAKMVGAWAYHLELGEHLRFIHDVFHISLLEPFRRCAGEEDPEPEPIKVDDQMEWEVDEVLDSWWQKNSGLQYLLQWKGYSDLHDTWTKAEWINVDELLGTFHECYLDKPQPDSSPLVKCKCGRPVKECHDVPTKAPRRGRGWGQGRTQNGAA